MSLEIVLSELKVSMDRLSQALENSLKHPPVLASQTEAAKEEKKPKTKKTTNADSAAPVPPVPPTSPEVPPVTGSEPAPTSSATSKEDEDEDFLPTPPKSEEKPLTADDVRAMAVKCAGAKGENIAKEIIKTIGNSPHIKSMEPSKFKAVMDAFKKAMKG